MASSFITMIKVSLSFSYFSSSYFLIFSVSFSHFLNFEVWHFDFCVAYPPLFFWFFFFWPAGSHFHPPTRDLLIYFYFKFQWLEYLYEVSGDGFKFQLSCTTHYISPVNWSDFILIGEIHVQNPHFYPKLRQHNRRTDGHPFSGYSMLKCGKQFQSKLKSKGKFYNILSKSVGNMVKQIIN